MFEKTRTLLAVYQARDPRGLTAADTFLRAPGFRAILAHRVAHFCALQGWHTLADGLSALSATMTGVRIHADARVGENVYLAPGVWLGPDAVVPDGAEVFPQGPFLLPSPENESDAARLAGLERGLSEMYLLVKSQAERIEALEAEVAMLEKKVKAFAQTPNAQNRSTSARGRSRKSARRQSPKREAPALVEKALATLGDPETGGKTSEKSGEPR